MAAERKRRKRKKKRDKIIRSRAPDPNITPPPTNHLVPKMTNSKNTIKGLKLTSMNERTDERMNVIITCPRKKNILV